MPPATCFLCHVPVANEKQCEKCDQSVYACSDGHMQAHRGTTRNTKEKNTEEICWPFKVETKPVVGNVLVATRDIKATELVLEEYPAAYGHHAKSKPCCMECLGTDVLQKEDKCPDCNFPLCKKEECQSKGNHKFECDIFKSLELKEDLDWEENCLDLMAVLPIRVLALMEANPEMWQKVDLLMDHLETMKDDERLVWQTQVIDPIQRSRLRSWTQDDILRAIGIISTNGVSLGAIKGCALYPTFSFLSHSCVSNARFQIHHDKRIKVTALHDIPKGEEITISYLPCHFGNTLRRAKIQKNWYFDCLCKRCSDTTELGTYFDAIQCQKCSGYMLPSKALDLQCDWKCSQEECGEIVNQQTMKTLIETLFDEAQNDRELHIDKVEEKIQIWSKVLHPNHFLIVMLKKRLLDLYRLHEAPQDPIKLRNFLENQLRIGHDLLSIYQVLEPGYTLKRGRILRQLHLPTLQLAKMDLQAKKISLVEFARATKDSIRRMNDAVKCLEDFDLFIMASGGPRPGGDGGDNFDVECAISSLE